MKSVVVVIPARLHSSRLPRKLLLKETGKSLIQHTWEAACRLPGIDEIVIGTDSKELATAVEEFGGHYHLTGDHACGTDRVAEVVSKHYPDCEYVINLQGDEPEISSDAITSLIDVMRSDKSLVCATLACPIKTVEAFQDPNVVKVVSDHSSLALYFSRAPIPYVRDVVQPGSYEFAKRHIGIYAFRREFLLDFTSRPISKLESLEKLEQLRILEAGKQIYICEIDHPFVGIDTRRDYDQFVQRMRK